MKHSFMDASLSMQVVDLAKRVGRIEPGWMVW